MGSEMCIRDRGPVVAIAKFDGSEASAVRLANDTGKSYFGDFVIIGECTQLACFAQKLHSFCS